MEKFDYLVIQNIATNVISVRNGEISSAEKTSSGASYRIYDKESSIFCSSNNFLYNNFLEGILEKNEIIEIYHHLYRQSISITVSSGFPKAMMEILGGLGNVISASLEIKSEFRNSIILNSLFSNQKINDLSLISAEIALLINISNCPTFIKRQIILDPEINYEIQLFALFHSLVNDYTPYIKTPFVDVTDEDCDLILPPGQGGILIHETIGHALEADHFFENGGILRERMNKIIGDSSISISDICCSNNMVFSKYADDGSPVSNTNLIKNGVVVGLLSDQNTARKWGIPDTGNGRAETFAHPVIPRMRNTYLHNGSYSPQSIINNTKHGIYALDIGGGQVDVCSGEFIFNVFAGYYIESGVPIAMTKPFLFRGNVLDTLSKIDMIGNDLSFHFATCGKKGQQVPISYGQPTVRIKGQRLGR